MSQPEDDLEHELSRLEARLADADGATPERGRVINELARVRRDLARRANGRAPFRLDDLRIAAPCKERWADMIGDDRARVCNGCDRPVFNLSAMTRDEAHAVLATRGITPCVRFRRRADGTVITADCPVGQRHGRRMAVMAGAVAAGAAFLAASAAIADPAELPAHVETSGQIQGVVKDGDADEPLIGATVVVSGSALEGTLAEITDENGFYAFAELPPGEYTVTIYWGQTTAVREVRVTIGVASLVNVELTFGPETIIVEGHAPQIDMGGLSQGITLDRRLLMGIPVGRSFAAALGGVAAAPEVQASAPPPTPPPPPHRPTIEWSSWVRLGFGTEAHAPAGVARLIRPQPADRHSTWEAALGADVSVPVALHGDLRLGAWAEVRTSAGPVLGGELLLEDERILALRAGASAHDVTAAIAFGYLAPWSRVPWTGRTRYMIGVRLVASMTRSVDDPRDWSATAGLELEPLGALRYLLGIRSRY